jgi:NitT/TauT family transport system substrate-binding protein
MPASKKLFLFFVLVFPWKIYDVAGADYEKLTVAYSAIAAASIVSWGPKEAGIYSKYGLDVSLVYVAGTRANSALISGDAQVIQGSGAASVLARLAGSDGTIVAATTNVIPMRLVTTPDISSPKDIKGKTFGVTRFGSLTDVGLRKALSRLGVDAEKDVKLLQTGGEPENLLFMQKGLIKGALLSSLNIQLAKQMGYRELVDLADIKFPYPATVIATTDNFIRTRPYVLKLFLKSILEGIRYAKNNPDFTTRTLSKYTRISDPKVLASSYTNYVLEYIRDFPEITSAEIESVLGELATTNPRAKTADPKTFFDPAPLQELVREGFISRPARGNRE